LGEKGELLKTTSSFQNLIGRKKSYGIFVVLLIEFYVCWPITTERANYG